MTDSHGRPTGWFLQSGWWVEGAGAHPRADLLVSVHEHYHHRLQNSTSFGAVTYLLGRIAEITGDTERKVASDHFTDACRRTQEAFATWASITALGRGPAELDGNPAYRAHFDDLDFFASGLEGAYLRFHLAQAIARACMQSRAAEVALKRGLRSLELGDLRNSDRPDHRLRLLRLAGFDFRPAVEAALRSGATSDHEWMLGPELAAWMFGPARSDLFQSVNAICFEAVASVLERLGCPTLSTDGHLSATAALIADAERVAQRAIGVEPVGAADHQSRMWEVMSACESERVALPGPLLPARLVDPSVGAGAMVAGLGEDAHLFVALRRTEDVRDSYAWEGEPPAGQAIGAWLRRSVMEGGRRVVEWMDVGALGPGPIEAVGVDVHYSVVESALSSAAARPWRQRLTVDACTNLSDLRLADRLRYWVAASGVFRCCFLSATSFGRGLPVLIGRFEMDGNAAHVLLRPITSSAVGCFRGVFGEVDPEGLAIVEDAGFVQDRHRLVSHALAHLLGEEQAFAVRDG